jgi:hypothetical protein
MQIVFTYLLTHWRGRQALIWSFWVNLVGVRLLIFAAQNYWVASAENQPVVSPLLVYLAVLMLHGVLLVWQIVGVIRSCDHHFVEHRSMATLWGAQLAAVLLFLMSALYSLEAIQITFKPLETVNVFDRIRQEHAEQYVLSLVDNSTKLHIDGTLELGITKAVNQLLAENKQINSVLLNSDGGNIYEGRGLAKLISNHQLNTRVMERCASACTLAFIGGIQRTAVEGAKFGFHQYRVDAAYDIIATDVDKEQARDTALFLAAGVNQSFTRKMFGQAASGMWWPDLKELVYVGFLNSIDEH